MAPIIRVDYNPGEKERSYGIRVGPLAAATKSTVEVIVKLEIGAVDHLGQPIMDVMSSPVMARDSAGAPVQMAQPITKQRTIKRSKVYTFRDNGPGYAHGYVNQRDLLPSVALALASVGLDLDVRPCDGTLEGFIRAEDKRVMATDESRSKIKQHVDPLADVMLSAPEKRARAAQNAGAHAGVEAAAPKNKQAKPALQRT